MSERTPNVDLFDSTYRNFEQDVLRRVRAGAFGEDIGQNSWATVDELLELITDLHLSPARSLLDVACGAGGPALFIARATGCKVTGVDINEHAIPTASAAARASDLASRVTFVRADASARLPFAEATFDAVVCIDSIHHFIDRRAVLLEWYRLLPRGGRVLYTDPVIVSGIVTNEEIALRSSIGYFQFAPMDANMKLIGEAGFELVRHVDATENAAVVAKRWHDARASDRDAMIQIEGAERFEGLQRFFAMVHRVSAERRLSRHAFVLAKPA